MTTKTAFFETADLSEFDSVQTDSGDLSASAAAKKVGDYGLSALIDSTGAIWGRFDFVDATRLRMGFYFDPNTLTWDSNDDFYLVSDSSVTADYTLRFVKRTTDLKLYAQARDDVSAWQKTAEITITDDWHWIEIDCFIAAGPGDNDGFIKLWIDDDVTGAPTTEVTGIDNDTRDLDNFLVGACGSIDATISGTLYYDHITVNDDGTPIGPPSGVTYKTLAGVGTSSGVLAKKVLKPLVGTLTSSGALTKETSKQFAGTLTSSGALVKKTSISLSGILTSAGALTAKVVFRISLAGAGISSGTLVKKTLKSLTGALTSSGALIKKTWKPLSGTLTSAGTLVGKVVFRISLAGVGTSSGVLFKKTLKSLQGVGTSAGTVVKKTLRSLSGVGTSAGALVKKTLKSLVGTLTSAGTVVATVVFRISLAGVGTSAGTLIKKTLKSLGGTGTSSGTLATVASIAALLISSFVRAVRSGWFLPVPAYDTFTRANGALGSTELVGPDGQRISAVPWNNRVGTTLIVGNTASASVLVGGIAIATVVGTLVDVWVIAPLTRVGGDIGVVVRYADTSNYVIAYHDGANVHLDKIVGGGTTPVLNVASAYAAGRVIRLICEGTAFRLYYNDLLIGTAVIADAGVQNGVEYGLYSTNVGNSQADITVVPRGSGEYSKLDTWGI